MSSILHILPLFGFVGAVAWMTAHLSRKTRHDEERWTLDRRKRQRRDDKRSRGLPPPDSGERRSGERRRATSLAEHE